MQTTPLNASANTAGSLLSNTVFEIPPFQREYSWGDDEVKEFWTDLSLNIRSDTYFLGLIILTEGEERKYVVDGQQRLITLTLLANAIYHEAEKLDRTALADRVRADFIKAINFDTDEVESRIILSDEDDNSTFQYIIDEGKVPKDLEDGSVSAKLADSHRYLLKKLREDLAQDPFKRLGLWTRFLREQLYFAVFLHPDASSAYQVYEVINTRGKELTTADLLKNYVLHQTAKGRRMERYGEWQKIQKRFGEQGGGNFVQFIRHSVTVECGYILPKDLFGFIAGRIEFYEKEPPTVKKLMTLLKERLPLYLQMIDPSADGPAEPGHLEVFSALNSLNVLTVRPLLIAISDVADAVEGMDYILRLVVRRIVVGNLGTGNIERRFGEAARKIARTGSWASAIEDLRDLDPPREFFEQQLKSRSLNKGVLSFVRRSVVQNTRTPDHDGFLHFLWTRQASSWTEMSEEEGSYWGSTIGNTLLVDVERRPKGLESWADVKEHLLPEAIEGEWSEALREWDYWDAEAVGDVGETFAQAAGDLWYGE